MKNAGKEFIQRFQQGIIILHFLDLVSDPATAGIRISIKEITHQQPRNQSRKNTRHQSALTHEKIIKERRNK